MAAATQSRAFRAGIASLPARAGTGDHRLATQAASQEAGQEVAAGALVRAPGRVGERRPDRGALGRGDDLGPLSRRHDLALVLALPAIRPDPSIRRNVCGAHSPPLEAVMPRSFRSEQIARIDSPARNRVAHSRTISASSGRTVRRSSSYP